MGHPGSVFTLLSTLGGDEATAEILSEEQTIASWLRVEVALTTAQAKLGLVPLADRDAIAELARVDTIDRQRLWAESKVVGYPILPLVRQLDEQLAEEHRGSLHLGATTQDVMDSALVLQLVAATERIRGLLEQFCDAVAGEADRHRWTVMAGRTHGMQAVPTTWGGKLAVYLGEFSAMHRRLRRAASEVGTVSLYGAGGTSAAYGCRAGEIRKLTAELLGLRDDEVPWHVARGRIAEWGQCCVSLTAALARLAREVIDLSRTEVGELSERDGHHRGASSTMPQKRNPITSEILVGNSVVAGSLASSLSRIMEAGHERAAGEWQAEWFVLPHLAELTGSSLRAAVDLVDGLRVDEEAMRRNLSLDHGLIMAEACMIGLAPVLGRERAHDLVYAAASRAREQNRSLRDVLGEQAPPGAREHLDELVPENYVGDPDGAIDRARCAWQDEREGASGDN